MIHCAPILDELASIGVSVHVGSNGRLKLVAQSGDVSPEAVELAKRHKAVLLTSLAGSCSPHNNMANYLDGPSRNGRIRSTCRACGRFIGYRLAGN